MLKFMAAFLFAVMVGLSPGMAFALTLEEFGKKYEELGGNKKPDRIIKLCNEALAGSAKGNAEFESAVYGLRGNMYWIKKDFKRALEDGTKAVEVDPESLLGWIVLGEALRDVGLPNEGAVAFDRAAEVAGEGELRDKLTSLAEESRLKGLTLSPAELWKAFDENEVAAEDTYKGKVVVIKGKIDSITTSPTGYPMLNFAVDKFGINTVNAEFEKQARPQIAKLKKGQQVLVKGSCRGMVLRNVIIRNSEIVE